jgi:hypothetical protein
VVAYLTILPRLSPGESEEIHEDSYPGYPLTQPSFETRISRIQIYSIKELSPFQLISKLSGNFCVIDCVYDNSD